MFKGRKLLIVTKHGKEKVIAPLLEKELGVECHLVENFDTDVLGTFSGEIERKHDPITTARLKCLRAMEVDNLDLAIASEGPFGPHPSLFFIPADEEFLLLLDKKNDLEILVKEISTDTNFNGSEVTTLAELNRFIEKTKSPSHGLIIKNDNHLVKGITDHESLKHVFEDFISKYGKAFVETDMRALYNPTRMKIIERAVIKLTDKAKSLCPQCSTPGFGITAAKEGLPCELCNSPTRSIISTLSTCQKCDHTNEEQYPNGKQKEDPTYCDLCNP